MAVSAEQRVGVKPSLIDLLHGANQAINHRFSVGVGDAGPTPRQLAVLQALERTEGLSQADISSDTGIDRATTAGIVARLIRAGCLKRRRTSRDARAYAVNLTDRGREELAAARRKAEQIEDEFLSVLSETERERLFQYLTRIAESS